jgi:hypothetical protein
LDLVEPGRPVSPAIDAQLPSARQSAFKGCETFWGGGEADPSALSVEAPLANAQGISDFLAALQPKTDAQKRALATANQYLGMVEQLRLRTSQRSVGQKSQARDVVRRSRLNFRDG